MSLASGLQLLRDIAAALRYAHSQGVVHRDLKPANIVLRDEDPGQCKIIDFGLVRVLDDKQLTKLTKEGQLLGSPLYLSPEQGQTREELSGAADVYALAGIAYFLFSGSPVFPEEEHETLISLVLAHLHTAPEKLSERWPTADISDFLDQLLLDCLAKDPGQRPSAEEMVMQLERLYSEELSKLSG
jgi:serine/threonine-protein kinase